MGIHGAHSEYHNLGDHSQGTAVREGSDVKLRSLALLLLDPARGSE